MYSCERKYNLLQRQMPQKLINTKRMFTRLCRNQTCICGQYACSLNISTASFNFLDTFQNPVTFYVLSIYSRKHYLAFEFSAPLLNYCNIFFKSIPYILSHLNLYGEILYKLISIVDGSQRKL